MREEAKSNAQDPCKRRLFRAVLSLNARTSGHDQGGGQAIGEHNRIRARAHRRLPDDVRAAKPSGRGAGSRYEEPQNRDAPRIRSAPAGPEVSDPPGGTGNTFQVRQALTIALGLGGALMFSLRAGRSTDLPSVPAVTSLL